MAATSECLKYSHINNDLDGTRVVNFQPVVIEQMFAPARRLSPLERLASPNVAAICFAVLVGAGIWAVVIWQVLADQRDTYEAATAELLGAQDLLAAQIGRTLESAESIVETVDGWLSDHPATADLADLAALIERRQRRHQNPVNIRLFDADGNMMPLGFSQTKASTSRTANTSAHWTTDPSAKSASVRRSSRATPALPPSRWP